MNQNGFRQTKIPASLDAGIFFIKKCVCQHASSSALGVMRLGVMDFVVLRGFFAVMMMFCKDAGVRR
jgi:hypothetical protein